MTDLWRRLCFDDNSCLKKRTMQSVAELLAPEKQAAVKPVVDTSLTRHEVVPLLSGSRGVKVMLGWAQKG